jgi:DNA-binding NarL/FixJ family response regulator
LKTITALLSDDHVIFREGLRILLRTTDDNKAIGEAESGRRAVDEAKRLQPDIILMDIAMPLMNGFERRVSVHAIREAHAGNAVFSPPIAQRLLKRLPNRDRPLQTSPVLALASRQVEVLQLVADGDIPANKSPVPFA